MVTAGAVRALALADFRERRRRPGYLAVLLGTLGLGLLAAPVGDSRWQVFQVSDHLGRYTSGYVGTVTALGGAVWLSLAGFGITRGTVARDERTGVGQVLAATPLSRLAYLAGKFLSNLLVLGSMLLALAGTALAVQLLKGDSDDVDVVRLLLPYVLITLPLLAAVAGCAVLFDTVPGLRDGPGMLLWSVLWLTGVLGAQASRGYDLLGMRLITASIRSVIAASGYPAETVEFGVGLTADNRVRGSFDWPGLGPGEAGGLLGHAGLTAAVAVALALAGAAWFHRFDRAASPVRRPARQAGSPGCPASPGSPASPGAPASGPTASGPAAFDLDPARMTPAETAPSRAGGTLLAATAGELRVLVQGRRLWWAGTLGLALLAAVTRPDGPTHAVLPFAMLWPVLLWSRMGHRTDGGSVGELLAACPAPARRLLAGLLAGVVLALAVAAVPIARLLAAGQFRAVAAALAGVLLVPALALLCGSVTRGPRLFQSLYPMLWYGMVNHLAGLDFLGVDPDRGPAPAAVAATAAALALGALALEAIRESTR
ncbi:ABC transporter permease [Kitasatospora sp. NPDC057936]|uniref:ABC transporter permease n=1 Tax=Kitasatospora sp. NPDC057936 TaxID=3346283 RepID=UPI0036D7F60D